jgi:predicted exporter
MVPVATALALIAGITHLAGLALNIPSVIAAMVVVGIVSDYGMFMVYYCKYRYRTGTILAVTLAAVTTLIGAGVLLFAQHPVLFSIGVTLVTGVLSGYLSSLLIIPALYELWKEKVNAAV